MHILVTGGSGHVASAVVGAPIRQAPGCYPRCAGLCGIVQTAWNWQHAHPKGYDD